MGIIKIVIVALVAAVVSLYLKKYSPETAALASIAGGLIIIFLIADSLFGLVDTVRSFFSEAQMDSALLKIIFKVTAIAYLVEFSAGAVRDLGEASLAEKVTLAGKIAVLVTSFPVIGSLFSMIVKLVNG
ncbi:MAG: hypothetical protein IJU84_01425 [Clostridia bacterium]|nr:hypothetical protein [Clostridia bacterium]MBQ9480807.1 hypothetical protein [Clostridia bacterium]